MKNRINRSPKFLHRSWIRLLPYTAMGAFLISFKTAENFNSLVVSYFLLMSVQLGAVAVYLLINKVNSRQK
ncbi:hypothetical protein [Myxosarcina sp. GI1]|uniref:hypothetical protein n=1 Tax=Myxosarcina sp. GI1 TaxID=1541065 RepID=UPI000565B274|nr:hypothetical protein [Myxosarcina sp. GI1]